MRNELLSKSTGPYGSSPGAMCVRACSHGCADGMRRPSFPSCTACTRCQAAQLLYFDKKVLLVDAGSGCCSNPLHGVQITGHKAVPAGACQCAAQTHCTGCRPGVTRQCQLGLASVLLPAAPLPLLLLPPLLPLRAAAVGRCEELKESALCVTGGPPGSDVVRCLAVKPSSPARRKCIGSGQRALTATFTAGLGHWP